MSREKIQFEPGARVRVQLDASQSKPIEGRNGTDYMRVCDNDERIMFCPQGLELAITESGAQAGDVIQITQIGSGKRAHWDVGIVAEVRQLAAAPRPAAAAPRPPAQQMQQQQPAGPAPIATREITSEAAEMTSAYVAAIEATHAAEDYAARAGMRDLHFSTPEAIRATAMTIFIQRSKAGRA